MSATPPWLVRVVAILTLLAYLAAALFLSQGFWPSALQTAALSDLAALVFAAACVLACLLALFAMQRASNPKQPLIVRLPASRSARWALGLGAAFYPAVFLFTGNTLFNFLQRLGLPDQTFRVLLRGLEGFGLWLVVACALGAVLMALVALIRNKERALVLGLPLMPVLLVVGFILGELLGTG